METKNNDRTWGEWTGAQRISTRDLGRAKIHRFDFGDPNARLVVCYSGSSMVQLHVLGDAAADRVAAKLDRKIDAFVSMVLEAGDE